MWQREGDPALYHTGELEKMVACIEINQLEDQLGFDTKKTEENSRGWLQWWFVKGLTWRWVYAQCWNEWGNLSGEANVAWMSSEAYKIEWLMEAWLLFMFVRYMWLLERSMSIHFKIARHLREIVLGAEKTRCICADKWENWQIICDVELRKKDIRLWRQRQSDWPNVSFATKCWKRLAIGTNTC